MSQFADRIRETTTTTGTGPFSLNGAAAANYRTFVAGIGNGKAAIYTTRHRNGSEWETGLGVVTDATPDTLSRLIVLSSSNANALVNFTAGTKDVFVSVTEFHMRNLSQLPRRVRAASTANVASLVSLVNGFMFDGVTLATGDRIFLKDQSTATENGIYTVNGSGVPPTRAVDYYPGDGVAGTIVIVEAGTVNADTVWLCTSNTGSDVVGTNNLAFIRLSGPRIAAIAGLTPTDGNIIVGDGTTWVTESGDTARQSLGLATTDTPQFTRIGIGVPSLTQRAFQTGGTLNGSANLIGYSWVGTFGSDGVATADSFFSFPFTQNASFTLANLYHFRVVSVSKGAANTITNQTGLFIADLSSATNNFGIQLQVSAGSGKWNIYETGTAENLLNGPVILGSSAAPTLAADQAAVHAIDAAAGNRCVGWKTENGQVGKLYTVNSGSAYAPTNVTTDRAFDADATTLAEIADVLGTLIADLKLTGLIA